MLLFFWGHAWGSQGGARGAGGAWAPALVPRAGLPGNAKRGRRLRKSARKVNPPGWKTRRALHKSMV